MKKVLKIYFGAAGTRPWLMLLCLMLAGISEMASLGTLLPVATKIAGGASANSSGLNDTITGFLTGLGITPTLGVLIVIVVVTMTLKAILVFLALSYAGYSVAKVATVLRTQLLAAMLNARWSYFVENRGGRIANSISNDATRAGEAYIQAARYVALLIQSAGYIIVAIVISPKLALAGVAVGLVMLISLNQLIKIGRRAGFRQTDHTSSLVTYVSDALSNMKPIRAMERQANFSAFFANRIARLRRALIKRYVSKQGLIQGQEVLKIAGTGAGIYLATKYWNIPLPELVVTGVIFIQVISLLAKMQSYLQSVAEVESAYWRTIELIDDIKAHAEPATGTATPTLTTGARFDHVSFSHGDTPVINDISLDIPAGGITVLQGPSGAGKTTIIDLLIGLHRPGTGQITIDGMALNEVSMSKWRRMIGYVPQELSLLHGSIAENLTLGDANVPDEGLWNALELAGARDFVENLPDGLATSVGEMGAKLSGGQRQRIALARALVLKPRLLILDEVTSALDPETEKEICDKISELAGTFTIIAITHRQAWSAIATRNYQVEGGTVRLLTRSNRRKKTKAA